MYIYSEKTHIGIVTSKQTQIAVRLDEEQVVWIDSLVARRVFASRAHAVQFAVEWMKETWKPPIPLRSDGKT